MISLRKNVLEYESWFTKLNTRISFVFFSEFSLVCFKYQKLWTKQKSNWKVLLVFKAFFIKVFSFENLFQNNQYYRLQISMAIYWYTRYEMIESKWSYVCRSNMGTISRCALLSIISNAAVQTALNEWSELVTNSTRIQWTRCWQSYLLRALLALVVLLYEVIACELKFFEFVWKLLLFRYANN